VTGSFAFEKGDVRTVNVTGGLVTGAASSFLTKLNLPQGLSIPATGAPSTELSFMTIGASNVHAFIGMNGPYWLAGDKLTVNASSSSYVLTDGSDSATLNYDASPAQIQTALEGFASIGSGNVTVTPIAGSPGSFNVLPAGLV